MYSCSQCNDSCKADEFSCTECETCINCGGCNCKLKGEPNEHQDFNDNDFGQNGFEPWRY